MVRKPDTTTVRIVAGGLVLIAVIGIIAAAVLLARGVDTTGVALLTGFIGTAVGGLASLLASTHTEVPGS